MKVSEAAKLWLEYHKCHSKENSIRAYRLVLTKFCEEFGAENLEAITTEGALSFLNRITEGKKQHTKKTRYSQLLAFFNFIKNHIDQNFRNPCDTPMLKKLFKARPCYNWNIIEKETVNEIIFRTGVTVATVRRWAKKGVIKTYPYDDRNGCLFEHPGVNSPLL